MTREPDALRQIYGTTRGYCHCCRRKLAFAGYARVAGRGAWDIDARWLRPACAACLVGPAPRARREPAAHAAVAELAVAEPAAGMRHTLLGGLLGAFMLGPWGALLGGLLGAELDDGAGRPRA